VFILSEVDKMVYEHDEDEGISPSEVRQALVAMHQGLLTMQNRLDDHEDVIEKLMVVMQGLTAGKVPDGFRQPKKGH